MNFGGNMAKTTIGILYDFDKTLCTTDMQEYSFIKNLGMTSNEFWGEAADITEKHEVEKILAYMFVMIKKCKEKGIPLTEEYLNKCGENVVLFKGVETWFDRINEFGESLGVKIEHYINSSGLAEMIEGTEIASEFKRIFACSFIYNKEGEAEWPGVAVDYTAKTQFLFKINKGILSIRDNKKVNESQAEDIKRIPFPHMIYFGDGETDVPCMKIVKMFGGNSIGVYNPENKKKINVAKKLLRQHRVNFIAPACYTYGSRMHQIVCTIIDKIKADFELAKLAKHI